MKLPGYEFIDKEIREKFNKTEYGKHCNKCLYMSLKIFIFTALLILFGLLIVKLCCEKYDNFICSYGCFYSGIIVILGIITCYFDGKRDGAIKQFELGLNQKKTSK